MLVAKAAAKGNSKMVTLELGGKSPNIIFGDANLDRAIEWSGVGIYCNAGQGIASPLAGLGWLSVFGFAVCCAGLGLRIYV